MMRRIPCWLLLFPLVGSAPAQVYKHHTAADAPALSFVHALLLEPRGYLWAATGEGLVRYDGEHFRTHYHDDRDPGSIPHDQVERMHRAPDGRIWLTSFNGGLAVYDPARDRFLDWQQLTGAPDTTAGHATRAVHALSSDSILVGAADIGLWLCLPAQGAQVRVDGWGSPSRGELVERIVPLADGSGELLVLTSHQLLRLDRSRMLLRPVVLPFQRDQGVGFPFTFTDLVQEGDGGLWLATWGGGVWRVDRDLHRATQHLPDTRAPFTASRNIIHRLVPTPAGSLWAASQRGLLRLDTADGTFALVGGDPADPLTLPVRNVSDILASGDGVYWVAHDGGLSEYDPAANRFVRLTFPNQLERSRAFGRPTGVVELDGHLLIGTVHGDGLIAEGTEGDWSVHSNARHASDGLAALQVLDLLLTRSGEVIAFTPAGIFNVDAGSGTLRKVLPSTFAEHGAMAHLALLEDHAGQWWIGRQHRGVYHVDPERDRVTLYSDEGPEHRRLNSTAWCQGIAEDATHQIWVSAYGAGLDRISVDRQRVDHFPATEHPWLRTGKVWDVAIDRQDRLWIGTNGEGLIITPAADPGGPGTVRLARAEGLPNLISTVHCDREGTIWCGGPSGLFRVDPGDLSVGPIGRQEGLLDTDLHHADIRDHPSGRVTIPQGDALVMVRKSDLGKGPGPFMVAWRNILVQGGPLVIDGSIDRTTRVVLQPGQNLVELQYGAVAFSLRERIRLAHQLVGVDPGPVITGSSGAAVYTGLTPGTYRFVLRDLSEGADPTEPVKEMAIVVEPTFWQMTLVRSLVALCLIGGLVLIVRWRMKLFQDKERLHAAHVKRVAELEMRALKAQMNPHFLFNSLNSINWYIVKNEPRVASEYLTKFSRLMRHVLRNSQEQLVTLKEELETLRLYIELEALRFEEHFDHRTIIELDEDPENVMIPPMLLQPYVENAIWHGLLHKKDGDPTLRILVRRDVQGALVLEIVDNGIGRRKAGTLKSRDATKGGGMGMQITQDRMDLAATTHGLRTEVEVIDLYDAERRPLGTKVVIRIMK